MRHAPSRSVSRPQPGQRGRQRALILRLFAVLFVVGLILPFVLWMHGIPMHAIWFPVYFGLLCWIFDGL